MDKLLPRNVTSYDLLKTLAVVTMLIDHVGYYFFLDDMWWRAIGRMSFPIWFFLAGYANTREIPLKFWIGGAFLLLMNGIVGMGFLPLNAIFSIIIIRLVIDHIMRVVKVNPAAKWGVVLLFVLVFFQTNSWFEYGTLAILFAMFGYMVRHGYGEKQRHIFMFTIMCLYMASQELIFGFGNAQLFIVAAGTVFLCLTMLRFRLIEYPGITFGRGFLQFCGRRTLEIYVVHLTVFKIAALCLGDERFELFRLKLFLG